MSVHDQPRTARLGQAVDRGEAMAMRRRRLMANQHVETMLRQAMGPAVALVVPGIRPAGSAAGDQARTMTPAQAISAGADWIVVGRPITGASDPGSAAADIAAGIQ